MRNQSSVGRPVAHLAILVLNVGRTKASATSNVHTKYTSFFYMLMMFNERKSIGLFCMVSQAVARSPVLVLGQIVGICR